MTLSDMQALSIYSVEVPSFQRGIKPAHPIKGKYNELLEGAGTVAIYGGKRLLLDGQQRVAYKKKAILDGNTELSPKMWFACLHDLTFSEMAEVYIKINKDRAGMAPYDLHKAGIEAKVSHNLKLQKIAESYGLIISPLKRKDGSALTVISPLLSAIEKGREADVEEALDVITSAFPQQTVDNRVIVGYLTYLQNCREAGGRSGKVATREYAIAMLLKKFGHMAGLRSAGIQRAAENNSSEYSGVARALETALGIKKAKR